MCPFWALLVMCLQCDLMKGKPSARLILHFHIKFKKPLVLFAAHPIFLCSCPYFQCICFASTRMPWTDKSN